jgi:ribosomal protein S18 acetylase RimI-like enzyme
MEIRHIEERTDVRGLVRAHGLAWQEAYDGILPDDILQEVTVDPSEEELDQWEEGLAENREGVLVAVEDDVCGFLDMRWGDADSKAFVGENEAGLKAIYVHPDYWGDGVGTALLERGLDLLPESIQAIRLDVFADNEDARAFYESRGFEQTGTDDHEIAGESYPVALYTLEL